MAQEKGEETMKKAKLRDQVEKLRALTAGNTNPYEAARAAEKLREFEAILSRRVRGIFEKMPGSGIWWIRYVDSSRRYRREKIGSYSAAVKLYHKRKQEALEGVKLPETLRGRPVSFSELADDALAYSRQHKRSYRDD